ncbi:MAG: nicotinate-nicotinamide nucleotide adenylyltransferase [Desulfobacterales bacterium]|nr:nicotinate-nicotinamide nucleotide adenylyltransferase [Desulfobacterales bacterium]
MIRIGIDIHGVADASSRFFSELTHLLVQTGHEVHILTGSEHTDALEQYLREDLGLAWTHLFSITTYQKQQGTPIRYIHDNPFMDPDLWDKAKAEYCKNHEVQLHLDDSSVYGKWFQTPYAKFYSNTVFEKKKKIGVIGGSFNPVTSGHIQVAQAVLNTVPDIHQIWLMPAYMHKFGKHTAYSSDRIQMLRLVETEKIRYFEYEIENRLSGETFVTFNRLLDDPDYKHQYEFCMVIGSDCVFDFDSKWLNAELLSHLIQFIVVPRPGFPLANYHGLLSKPPHILLKDVLVSDISATLVRERIQQGQSITGLVPEAVEEYIAIHRLYG